ncbi:hypothetical protein KI387_036370, partial [Taxus chinensis]
SADTQDFGLVSGSGEGYTIGSGMLSQTIGAQFNGTLGTLGATASGPLLAAGGSRGGTNGIGGTGPGGSGGSSG